MATCKLGLFEAMVFEVSVEEPWPFGLALRLVISQRWSVPDPLEIVPVVMAAKADLQICDEGRFCPVFRIVA